MVKKILLIIYILLSINVFGIKYKSPELKVGNLEQMTVSAFPDGITRITIKNKEFDLKFTNKKRFIYFLDLAIKLANEQGKITYRRELGRIEAMNSSISLFYGNKELIIDFWALNDGEYLNTVIILNEDEIKSLKDLLNKSNDIIIKYRREIDKLNGIGGKNE